MNKIKDSYDKLIVKLNNDKFYLPSTNDNIIDKTIDKFLIFILLILSVSFAPKFDLQE